MGEKPRRPSHGATHLWIPATLSGLMLLVFFPLILRLSAAEYEPATNHSAAPYLGRWLLFTASVFLASALIYVLRALHARRRTRQDEDAVGP